KVVLQVPYVHIRYFRTLRPVRWAPSARQHARNGGPFFRDRTAPRSPLPARRTEDRPHLEQPDIPVSVGPVEFHPPDQPGQEPPTEVCFVARQGVPNRDRLGSVRWPEWNGACLEQAGAHEPLAHTRPSL